MRPLVEVPHHALIVFDMDDTLYLERDFVRSGFEAVGEYVHAVSGVGGFAAALWKGFESGVRGKAFDRALEELGHQGIDLSVAELVERYRSHDPSIDLLPDARRLLRRLERHALGLITDGPAVSQWAKIRALGIESDFELIVVTGDHGDAWTKPSPLPYVHCESLVDGQSERCWYIGDNPSKDFSTPLARGWTSIRVRRPDSLHADSPTPAGVVEVSSLDQLQLSATPLRGHS